VETWKDFPQKLSERLGRTVVAYDRLGFGQSSPRHSRPSIHFVKEEATVYLPRILDQLKIEQCALLGHSVGGGMAISAAAHLRHRVTAIITEAAQTFVEDRTVQGLKRAQELFQDPNQIKRLEKYHGDKARWVLDAWIGVWLSPEFADWSLLHELPLVQCPTLAIHGDQDEFGSNAFPESIIRLSAGPSQSLLIPDCKHVPHREKPDIVLDEVARFLKYVGVSQL